MAMKRNLTIDQGSSFSRTLIINSNVAPSANLSTYSCRAQIRPSHYSNLFIDITAEVSNVSNREITLSLTPSQTSNMNELSYVYDCEIYNTSNSVIRVFEGRVWNNLRVIK